MKFLVLYLFIVALVVSARTSVADPVIDSFAQMLRPYASTVQGRMRDVDLWYDRKSRTYEIVAEFPGANEKHLRLWGDESTVTKPLLYLEVAIPPRSSSDDITGGIRGGNAPSKMTLRVVLPEDADFRKGVYTLKDGVFGASIPRVSGDQLNNKRFEIPLQISGQTPAAEPTSASSTSSDAQVSTSADAQGN